MLDGRQRNRFDREGYLVLEDFVDPVQCARLRTRALELVAELVPEGPVREQSTQGQLRDSDEYFLTSGEDVRVFFEEDAFGEDGELRRPLERSINKLGHAMHDLDPVFDRFSRTDELAGVTSDVGLADPLVLQSMYIFKQPEIGGEVAPHCDHTYLWTEPASVIGFWFAIEDASIENGCLRVLPRGHRLAPPERFRVVEDQGTTYEQLGADTYPTEGFVPLEVPAGTLVVLDGRLPHYSEPNRSSTSRHAYTAHLIDGTADYLEDNWLQRPNLPLRGFG